MNLLIISIASHAVMNVDLVSNLLKQATGSYTLGQFHGYWDVPVNGCRLVV